MLTTRPETATTPLTITLFGAFDVRRGDTALPPLRTRKGQALLALLVLRHGRELPRAWLAGTLWPESDERAALDNLRRSLTDLRRALADQADRLGSPSPQSLTLDLDGAHADVVAFDQAITRGDPASLEAAVALYRGPLLEGWEEEWLFQEREIREQAVLQALETLAEHARQRGDVAGAERHLRRAAALDPLRESTQRGLR